MPTIAIVGAGQGMGLAIARLFGGKGFKVALLSRTPAHLRTAIADLETANIEVAAFRADVTDSESIVSGLVAARGRFGPLDVLEYSPSDAGLPHRTPTDLDRNALQPWLDFQLHGAMTAVRQVLPEMLERKSGTIIVTTGASSVQPIADYPLFAAAGVAMSALRHWSNALHLEVANRGVQVAHVAIGAFIGQTPETSADAIAPLYWELHTARTQFEKIFPSASQGATT